MTRIAAVAPVLPPHVYTQAEITRELAPLISPDPSRRAVLERMHAGSGIGTRHTALPIEAYRDLGGFKAANDVFIQVGTNLAELALRNALDQAGLSPQDVDFVLFTSVTGIAAPSIDALLVPRMGLRPDVKRLPSFGLGCVAGAAGLARVHDYLVGHPTEVGVLLSVELCSLTLQRDDATIANFVATGLFGDGAAAVVMVGEDRPESGIRVVDTRSALLPETADIIGWNIGGTGFEIVLTAGVADVIERHFPTVVADFLATNRLAIDDVTAWIAHPGGPRVLDAFAHSLDVPQEAFGASWASLEQVGNLSSAAVLHVLAATEPAPGSHGLLFALGPGVSAEFVLLEWP
jgi:alkylresorcinol/alkylpyrone synthase